MELNWKSKKSIISVRITNAYSYIVSCDWGKVISMNYTGTTGYLYAKKQAQRLLFVSHISCRKFTNQLEISHPNVRTNAAQFSKET